MTFLYKTGSSIGGGALARSNLMHVKTTLFSLDAYFDTWQKAMFTIIGFTP